MGIIGDNPVLLREVRDWRRIGRRKSRRIRVLFWAALAGIGWFYLQGLAAFSGTISDARHVWLNGELCLLVLLLLLAPMLAATSIAPERERQTWDILKTTRLTGREVIFGKLVGRQIPIILMIALLQPPLLGYNYLGDENILATLLVVPFLLLTSALFGVIGMTCSFLAHSGKTALAVSLLITGLFCFVPVVLVNFIPPGYDGWDDHPRLLAMTPPYVLFALTHSLRPNDEYRYWWEFHSTPLHAIVAQYTCVSAGFMAACLAFMTSRYKA